MLAVGIVGLGILGRRYLELLEVDPRTEVVAVCDVRGDVVQPVAARVGARAFTDYQRMLEEMPLDLLIIATPDAQHTGPVLAAVEAGVKHVIVEKPLTTTLEDAATIYRAVELHGPKLFVNYANRASPLDIATKRLVESGLLGEVVHVEVALEDDISVPLGLWGDRSRDWASSSSPAHFLLSHVVDLLRWYLSPREADVVYAVKQQRVLRYTPDLYDVLATWEGGVTARMVGSWVKRLGRQVQFELCLTGTNGTLIYHKLPGEGCRAIWRVRLSGARLEEVQRYQQELASKGIELRLEAGEGSELALASEDFREGDLMALVRYILDAVAEDTYEPVSWRGNGPLPNHLDGLRQVEVVHAVLESCRMGSPVSVSFHQGISY